MIVYDRAQINQIRNAQYKGNTGEIAGKINKEFHSSKRINFLSGQKLSSLPSKTTNNMESKVSALDEHLTSYSGLTLGNHSSITKELLKALEETGHEYRNNDSDEKTLDNSRAKIVNKLLSKKIQNNLKTLSSSQETSPRKTALKGHYLNKPFRKLFDFLIAKNKPRLKDAVSAEGTDGFTKQETDSDVVTNQLIDALQSTTKSSKPKSTT